MAAGHVAVASVRQRDRLRRSRRAGSADIGLPGQVEPDMLLLVQPLRVQRERSWSWSWFSVVGRARPVPNHAGAHFLQDRGVAAELVRRAGVRPGDLVLDLGAGSGAITAPLAAAGARVLAIERDA